MEAPRFCGQCGVQNAATENFCTACGSPLQKTQGIAVTAPPVQTIDQQSHVAKGNVSSATTKTADSQGIIGEISTTPKGLLSSGVVYVIVYLIVAIPTYVLPYFGSNSSVLNVFGAATGLGALPQFWFHLVALYLLVVVAWIRGGHIGKQWLAIFPVLAAIFDMVPGFSVIPLLPTIFHVLALVMGVSGKLLAVDDTAAGKRRIVLSAVGFAAVAILALVKTQTFFLNAKQGPSWEKPSAHQQPSQDNTTPAQGNRYSKTIEVKVKNYDDQQICGLQSGEGMRFEVPYPVYATLQNGTQRLLSSDAMINNTVHGEAFEVKSGCVTMSLTRIEEFRVSPNAILKELQIVRIKFYK